MNSKLARGMTVINLADGVTLGKIDHVYLDPEAREVVAFSFRSGGSFLGGKTTHLVEIGDVHGIGPDAVTLSSAEPVRDTLAVAGKTDGLIDLEDMLHRTVVTEGGAVIGRINGMLFDTTSWQLLSLSVPQSAAYQTGTIDGAAVRRIGDEFVVVADPELSRAEAQSSPAIERETSPRMLHRVVDLEPVRQIG
jgi:sporulation protein YlmC with PRC-barrel domain